MILRIHHFHIRPSIIIIGLNDNLLQYDFTFISFSYKTFDYYNLTLTGIKAELEF